MNLMTVDQQPDGSEEDFHHLIHQEMIHMKIIHCQMQLKCLCTTDKMYYVLIIRIGQG